MTDLFSNLNICEPPQHLAADLANLPFKTYMVDEEGDLIPLPRHTMGVLME